MRFRRSLRLAVFVIAVALVAVPQVGLTAEDGQQAMAQNSYPLLREVEPVEPLMQLVVADSPWLASWLACSDRAVAVVHTADTAGTAAAAVRIVAAACNAQGVAEEVVVALFAA